MKHFIAILGFLCLAAACAAQKPVKHDPSQYAITVHVSATEGSYSDQKQTLTVTIADKHYLLWGALIDGSLIDPGDYRAKLIQDEHKTTYRTLQWYEFLFPDGTTWKGWLSGESE